MLLVRGPCGVKGKVRGGKGKEEQEAKARMGSRGKEREAEGWRGK